MTEDPQIVPGKMLRTPSTWATWALLGAIFLAVQFASLFTPPLLDDVDASHAEVAQHMAESGDWVTMKLERHPLPREASSALLARCGALQDLRPECLRHPSAQHTLLACPRLARVVVDLARMGSSRGPLCWPRSPHFPRTLLVHALRHSRSPAELPSASGSVVFPHGHRKPPTQPLLPDVGSPRSRHIDQRAHRPCLLRWSRNPLPCANRTVAALA